jgi:hypothetical protein
MITVQPITPAERVHCAFCAKPLQPSHACRVTFYSHAVEARGRTPEQQLEEFKTNRRVVRVARDWHTKDLNGEPVERSVSSIRVTLMPENPGEWGFWGRFCGQQCAARFGFAAHSAGYRIQRRKAA